MSDTVDLGGLDPTGRKLTRRPFMRRHRDYRGDYWTDCRLLYEGGEALLGNDQAMRRLFPQHSHEAPSVYDERRARAFYLNYPGPIIDHLVAGLTGESLAMESEPEADSFYADEFAKNVRPPGGEPQTLDEMAKELVLTALLCERAWTLVELPPPPEPGEAPATLFEQQQAGLLRVYAQTVPPEAVVNWQAGKNGALRWALTMDVSQPQDSLFDAPDTTVEQYVLYTPTEWTRFECRYPANEQPTPDTPMRVVGGGRHSFGRVPLIPFVLPKGLWAMAKLESLARELLNKSCAASWSEFKSLYCQLYEFLGAEKTYSADRVISEKQQDPQRARKQKRGPGYVQERGQDDKAMYVAPPADVLEYALRSIEKTVEAMHAVMHQMALSNASSKSAAALGRSAESKQQDRAATSVVLFALGQLMRRHIVEVYSCVSAGRGDQGLVWTCKGWEVFDEVSANEEIEEGATLALIPIQSPTFQTLWKLRLAKTKLADEATPDVLEKIRGELEQAHAQEALVAEAGQKAALELEPGAGDDDETDAEDKPGKGKPPQKGKP